MYRIFNGEIHATLQIQIKLNIFFYIFIYIIIIFYLFIFLSKHRSFVLPGIMTYCFLQYEWYDA